MIGVHTSNMCFMAQGLSLLRAGSQVHASRPSLGSHTVYHVMWLALLYELLVLPLLALEASCKTSLGSSTKGSCTST